jgi:Trk K+ transport system NAD-binding subunit
MPLMPLTRSDLEIVEAEIAAGSPAAEKEVEAVGLPAGAHIGAIVRKGQILHAHRDTKLEAGDRIIVFAPTADEQEVKKALFG